MTNIQLFSLSTNLFYLFLLKFCEEIFIVRDLVQIVLAFATQHEHPDQIRSRRTCQTNLRAGSERKFCGHKKTPQFLVGFLLEFRYLLGGNFFTNPPLTNFVE
jgi:hypothetical protein